MNVYDFDNTIYNGDSSADFCFFILRKYPRFIFKYLIDIFISIILYLLHIKTKEEFKETAFSFIKDIDVEKDVDEFWNINQKRIKKWYLENQKEDDVIISASPNFLLENICHRLGIKYLLCSKIDLKTGKYDGKNCKGKEKVDMFHKNFKDKKINEFYSDSLSDEPLANISENAYLVDGDSISKWPQKQEYFNSVNRIITSLFFIVSHMVFSYVIIFNYITNSRIFNYSFISSVLMAVIYCFMKTNIFIEFRDGNIFKKLLVLISTFGVIVFNIYRFKTLLQICYTYNIIEKKDYYDSALFYIIVGIFMAPFCIAMFSKVYSLLERIFCKLYKESSKADRIVSLFLAIFLIIYGIVGFSKASVLYKANTVYDAVYTSDTEALMAGNAWLNIFHDENDIRQPLFAVFSSPFVAPMYAFSFLFQNTSDVLIPIGILISNCLLIVMMAYILATLVEKRDRRIVFFIFYFSTFSVLLHSIMLEQYVVCVFWLVVLVYMYINKMKEKEIAFVGTTWSLLTSGIVFPLLCDNNDRIYKKIKILVKAFFFTFFVLLLFSRIDIIINAKPQLEYLASFSGKEITFLDRFIQYTNFIPNCFLAINDVPTLTGWHLKPLLNVNLCGIIIIFICIISTIINRKDKITIVSSMWSFYSFILLCVLGWGTAENGLILYSLYFSWSFAILLYKFIMNILDRIIPKNGDLMIIAFSLMIIIYNVIDLNRMIMYLSYFVD